MYEMKKRKTGEKMRENNSFIKGIKDGLPICLGYLSVAFAFGIFAVESGLTVLQALLVSMLNVTSAGQLAGVPIMTSGGGLIEIAVTQLVINLRYSLMSVSLSQKLGKSVSLADRFIISFVNTDEVFAVATGRREQAGKKYLYGLILTPYLGWSIGTFLGAVAGNVLPEMIISALGVAIYAMFIAIVVPPSKREKNTALCVLFSILLSCIFYYVPVLNSVPSGFVIIICAAISSALFALLSPIEVKEEAENE